MHIFRLVDLRSQARYIPRYVRQPRDRFFAWLRAYGTLTESSFNIGGHRITIYYFKSRYGLEAAFHYDADDGLRFPGQGPAWQDDPLGNSRK